jgi:Tol biopolymer transport system component
MNADGGQVKLVGNGFGPAWSPDGSKIAVMGDGAYDDSFPNDTSEIYVIDADSSLRTKLTQTKENEWLPRWSPDGDKIAYMRDDGASYGMYLMNADGSQQTKLSSQAFFGNPPTWSPDSSKIAFASVRDGNTEIYSINADGSNLTNLTKHPAEDFGPVWSPDGRQIVFWRIQGTTSGAFLSDIYRMNADGSDVTDLTNGQGTSRYPLWSPDSSQLLFEHQGSPASFVVGASPPPPSDHLYLMNANGSQMIPLPNTPAGAHEATWSSDGSKIAFSLSSDIYVVGVEE